MSVGYGSDPNEDPGWRSALRSLVWGFIPGLRIWRQQRMFQSGRTDGLSALRALFGSYCVALMLIGLAVVILSATSNITANVSASVFGIGLVVAGILLVGVGRWLRRPLDCTCSAKLAASYRTRFVFRLAFSETPALLGFVGFIVTGNGWLYALGAAFTAIGFYRLAPSMRNLARDQEELNRAGCRESLVTALRRMPPGWRTA